MDNLLKLYEAILKSLDIVADKDGLLSYQNGDIDMPYTVDGKRMVLPTRGLLKMGLGDELMAFHPLSESSVRTESQVLRRLKAAVNFRLSQVTAELLQQLVEIGVNTKAHSKIAPKAAKFLAKIPNVDEKSAHAMERILSKTSPTENQLVWVYLKRGGKLGTVKYARTAMVSFPFFEEFEAGEPVIFGTKIRKKDLTAFQELFEYILPEPDLLETYSAGSHSLIAPYFDALMRAYVKVATQLNTIVKTHRKELSDHKALLIDVDWAEALDNLGDYRDLIPPLPGNEGDRADGSQPKGAEVKTDVARTFAEPAAQTPNQPLFQTATPAAPTAAPVQEAPVEKSGNGVSFSSVLAHNAHPQQPPMGWNQPQMAPQPPQAPTYYRGVAQAPQYYQGNPGQPQFGTPPMPGWIMQPNTNQVVAGQPPQNLSWNPQQNFGGQPMTNTFMNTPNQAWGQPQGWGTL